MMKKFLILAVISVFLAACTPEQPQPVQQEVEEPKNEQQYTQVSDDKNGPYGSYIIIRHYATEPINGRQIFVDLYFNSVVVCTWDMGMIDPLQKDDELLYFAPLDGNCPNLDPRNGVVWHLQENWAEVIFESTSIQEIPVWELVGSQLYLLER